MGKKKKDKMELRFYEIPQQETVLARIGKEWDRVYGVDGVHLHFHNLMEIGLCRRGEGELWIGEESHRYETSMVSVIPENFPHVLISKEGRSDYWEFFYLNPKPLIEELFPDNPLYQSEVFEHINQTPYLLHVSEAPALFGTVNAIIEEVRVPKQYRQGMIRLLAKTMILEILRQDSGAPYNAVKQVKAANMTQIASALEYINQNYAAPIKAKMLADVCNMSETHFRRVFEEYINMAPMDYVNLIRVQQACERMKKTDDSMDNVALRCGFTTTSTFNRNFKKFLNTSPYQWKINLDNSDRKLADFQISTRKGW